MKIKLSDYEIGIIDIGLKLYKKKIVRDIEMFEENLSPIPVIKEEESKIKDIEALENKLCDCQYKRNCAHCRKKLCEDTDSTGMVHCRLENKK